MFTGKLPSYIFLNDNNTTNCIKSDKGNSIYVGVNIDNITPLYTSINLNAPTGYSVTTNTPIYYPDTTFIVNRWQPLSYTYTTPLDIYSPFTPTLYYRTISQSIVICNTTTSNSSYTGTSILCPILLQKEFVNFFLSTFFNTFIQKRYFKKLKR